MVERPVCTGEVGSSSLSRSSNQVVTIQPTGRAVKPGNLARWKSGNSPGSYPGDRRFKSAPRHDIYVWLSGPLSFFRAGRTSLKKSKMARFIKITSKSSVTVVNSDRVEQVGFVFGQEKPTVHLFLVSDIQKTILVPFDSDGAAIEFIEQNFVLFNK